MPVSGGVREAFALAGEFLSHKTYHSLTHAVLDYFVSLDGVKHAASYEIFEDFNTDQGFSIRRFPVTLDESFYDRNTELIREALSYSQGGMEYINHDDQDYFFLDIAKDVFPRRIILIKGRVSDADLLMVEGVFGIYAKQVALLDSKERDPLTGLPNRQTLDACLSDVVAFHQDNASAKIDASWMVVLDIDHFKNINDTYGHLFGDEVLIHFADLMKTSFRHTDFLFRYGGEEFVVILNNASPKQALSCLERFHMAVQDYNFPSGRVTVSIGYTQVNPLTAPTLLFEQADKALYEAKKQGRNRIVHSADILSRQDVRDDDVELF